MRTGLRGVPVEPLPESQPVSRMPPTTRTTLQDAVAADAFPVTGAFLLDWIARQVGDTERRQVAVAAFGLVRPAVNERPDSGEDLAAELASRRSEVLEIIGRHDGVTAGASGDVVVGFWGWPDARIDGPRQAVGAALEVAALRYGRHSFRCGVDVGIAIAWGRCGSQASSGIVGEVVRSATAMLDLAGAGEVVISPAAKRMVAGEFEVEEVAANGRVNLPGGGVRVVAPAAAPAARAPAGGRLIGRQRPIADLSARWCQLAGGGPGGVVLIQGEAGAGKTVLLAHLRDHVRAAGGTFAAARCLPDLRPLPLRPIMDLADALTRCLGRGPHRPNAHATPSQGILNLLQQARSERGRPQPCVIAVEDMQWADELSVDAIAQIGAHVSERARALLVLTSRSHWPEAVERVANAAQILLEPLPPVEAAAIVAAAAPADLAPEDIAGLSTIAGGNPLVARELGELAGTTEGPLPWQDLLAAPNRINPQLAALLDALGASKALLQAAAIAGQDVQACLLARMLQTSEDLLRQQLDALVRRGVLRVTGDGQGGSHSARRSYAFASPLMSAQAYGSVTRTKRQDLHARAADSLAHDLVALADAAPAAVAEHYSRSGDHAAAFRWWRQAAARASRCGSAADTIAHARNALAARLYAPEACPAEQEAELLSLLGTYLGALKGTANSETVAAYRRAVGLMSGLQQPPAALGFDIGWGVSMVHLVHGDLQQALITSQGLLEVADEIVMPVALRVHATACLHAGRIDSALAMLAQVGAIYDGERHASLRLRYGTDPAAVCLAHLAQAKAIAGHAHGSLEAEREALRMTAALRHPPTSANVLAHLAIAAQSRDDATATAALVHAAHAVSAAHGHVNWVARTEMIRGWLIARHAPDEGMDMVRRAVEAYRRAGSGRAMLLGHCLIAAIALDAGQPDVALQALAPVGSSQEQRRHWLYAAEIMRLEAMALHAAERIGTEDCADRLSMAARIAVEQGALLFAQRADRDRLGLQQVRGRSRARTRSSRAARSPG